MRRSIVLVFAISLSACAGQREAGVGIGGSAPLLSSQWLAGGWILEGQACESDGGIIYHPDGTWIAEGATGRWSIREGRLATVIVRQEMDSGEMVRLDPPLRKSEPIVDAATDHYEVRGEDGTVRRLKRCARPS